MTRRMTGLTLLLALVLAGGCANPPARTVLEQEEAERDSPAMINARLGLSYMQEGKLQVAESKLKKALAADPDLVLAHLYIAELYNRMQRYEEADRHFRNALKLAPDDGLLHNNYGAFLCSRGQYAAAEKHFLTAADARDYQAPDKALENAALCALGVPDTELAEAHLRRAIEINPRRARSLYLLAQLKYGQGDFMGARAFVERLYAVAPKTPAALLLGVRIERQLGARDTAAELARQLREQFPNAPETASLEEGR